MRDELRPSFYEFRVFKIKKHFERIFIVKFSEGFRIYLPHADVQSVEPVHIDDEIFELSAFGEITGDFFSSKRQWRERRTL